MGVVFAMDTIGAIFSDWLVWVLLIALIVLIGVWFFIRSRDDDD